MRLAVVSWKRRQRRSTWFAPGAAGVAPLSIPGAIDDLGRSGVFQGDSQFLPSADLFTAASEVSSVLKEQSINRLIDQLYGGSRTFQNHINRQQRKAAVVPRRHCTPPCLLLIRRIRGLASSCGITLAVRWMPVVITHCTVQDQCSGPWSSRGFTRLLGALGEKEPRNWKKICCRTQSTPD